MLVGRPRAVKGLGIDRPRLIREGCPTSTWVGRFRITG